MAISLGTLEQTIVERGGDELLRKLGLIDAAATRLGAKPITIGLSAPGTTAVAQGLSSATASVVNYTQQLSAFSQKQGEAKAATEQAARSATTQREASEQAAAGLDKQTAATDRLTKSTKSLDEMQRMWEADARKMAALRLGNQQVLGPVLPPHMQPRPVVQPAAATAQPNAGLLATFMARGAVPAVAANQQLAQSHAQAAAAANQQGAALQRTTQNAQGFTRSVTTAQGRVSEFGRSGIRALNGIAFGFSQMAQTGEVSLRSIASSATSALAFMGKGGAIGAIAATVGLAVFDIFRAQQKRALEERALLSQAAARDALVQEKARLDATEALEKASFDRGLTSLEDFYTRRAKIINDRTAAEVASREKQAAALEQKAKDLQAFAAVPGLKLLPEGVREALLAANLQQITELRVQAESLRAEARAAATQGTAEQARNTAERAAAERQVAEQILGFENRRREAQGETHEARLKEIEQEAAAFARIPLVPGETAELRAAKVKDFRDAMTAQANFERSQEDFERLQGDLATRRLAVQNRLNAGKISQLEADKEIASIERSAIPTLSQTLDLMEQFAQGNREAEAAVKRLRAELEGLGGLVEPLERRLRGALDSLEEKLPNVAAAFRAEMQKITEAGGTIPLTLVIRAESIVTAASHVQAEVEGAGLNIANVLTSSLAAGFSSSFTKGSGKSFFEALGISMLSGVGTVIANLGAAMLTYGLIMAAFAPAALLTPFAGYALSAPASIAAGTALLALGTGLGAIAANNTGSRTGGGGGGATSFSQANRDTVQHIWLDPDRNLPGRAADTATAITRSASAPATPMQPVNVYQTIIGAGDPVAQREVAALARNAVRAGYSLGNG